MKKNHLTILGAVLITLIAAAGGLVLARQAGWIEIGALGNGAAQPGLVATAADTSAACPHTLLASDCPFCTPSLIESKGFCHNHGVPEALCHLCDPSVIPAFKIQNDWCAEHDAPESLCPVCAPGAGMKYLSSGEVEPQAAEAALPAGTCPHTIAREDCPYCTPKLMVDLGFCRGHNTPEAFCALCSAPEAMLQAAGDWCAEHGQSETFCTVCSPAAKVAAGGGDCPHDLTPDKCPFCKPSMIVDMGFCAGHGVPEAFCHLCNPWVIPAFKARGDWCAEHESPESLCPVCSPAFAPEKPEAGPSAGSSRIDPIELLALTESEYDFELGQPVCDTEKLQVRLAPNIGAEIGLAVQRVAPRNFSETHTFNARIDYNRNRFAQLAARSPGIVTQVMKQPGDRVQKGETLAIIDSVEIGNAKAELLQAQALRETRAKDHEREQLLLEKGVSTEKDLLGAESALNEARIASSRATQALRNLGLGDREIERVIAGQDTRSQWEMTAPFEGTVIERRAVQGEIVDKDNPLFRIADTGVMWAWLDIYESELAWIREGQPLLFAPDSLKGEQFPGRIEWVSTELDPRTRTLRARVSLENREGRLRANMFGRAEVMFGGDEPSIIVAKDAVQWEGCCHIVFVKHSDMLYTPRKVRLGHELLDAYVIDAGLKGDEEIVTAGSFLLKTEIMKGSIGAGCCEINPGA